jgi:hypothetical protein
MITSPHLLLIQRIGFVRLLCSACLIETLAFDPAQFPCCSTTQAASAGAGSPWVEFSVLNRPIDHLSISTQPEDQFVRVHSAARFKIEAVAPGPVQYQWRFNGTALDGETNALFTLPDVSVSDEGAYSVTLSSGPDFLESRKATLKVAWEIQLTSVTSQRAPAPLMEGYQDTAGNVHQVRPLIRVDPISKAQVYYGLACAKFTPQGTLLWETEFLEPQEPQIFIAPAIITPAGRIYVTAIAAAELNTPRPDLVTIAFSPAGNIVLGVKP